MYHLNSFFQLATLAIIGALVVAGPFFDPLAASADHPVQISYLPGDGRLATIAGKLDKESSSFESSDRDGYLAYGPYMNLSAGCYTVTWVGAASDASRSTFDVFASTVGVLASHEATQTTSSSDGSLAKLSFNISKHKEVQGVEFRVRVRAEDVVAIKEVNIQNHPCGTP